MSACKTDRLVLGTVQLGMDYGVANTTGKPSREAARELLRAAWEGGIRLFDTAQGYGDSESLLGHIFADLGIANQARVITKFHPALDHTDPQSLRRSLEQSMERLGVGRLEGVLLHRQEEIFSWNEGPGQVVADLRDRSLLCGAGASVYSADHALDVLRHPDMDMVQLPVNVLDRRFERAGVFEAAARKGKTVFVRSIFLQGLLLMNPEAVPSELSAAVPVLKHFRLICEEFGVSPVQGCVAYVRDGLPEARMVFGAETAEQVRANLELWQAPPAPGLVLRMREAFADVAEEILNPNLWKQK